jgi:signal transduction histidine kinase/ligand-binding sensor domain-containing protein
MSVAPGLMKSILDRWSFRLVPIVLIAVFSWQWAVAQAAVSAGPRIIHETWIFKDGAPEAVQALAQTTDGYLWLGGESGLFRFDGVRFELFRSPFGDQLLSTRVSSLLAPDTGGLWVGYIFGGFSFLKGGRVTNFTELAFPTGTVNGFAQDRHGIVWAATDTRQGGLWRFDGSSWQHIGADWNAPTAQVAQVGFDQDGILWVLTENRSLEFGRQLFYLLPGSAKFQKASDNLFVQGFTWDADYHVLTTHDNAFSYSEFGIKRENSVPAYPILKKNSEQIVDRRNGIWFLPTDPFVLRHTAEGPLAEAVSEATPQNSDVYNVNPYRFSKLVDREGSIWIGDTLGVHRFSYSPLMKTEFPKSEANPFFALAPDEGGVVWISAGNHGGSSNLYRVTDGKAKLQEAQKGVANFAYRAQDNTFWFGGEGGLWHLVNGRLNRIALPALVADKSWSLQAITEDRRGGMWVSIGSAGEYRLAKGIWTLAGGHRELGLPGSSVLCEFTDKLGRIWFGNRNHTLTMLDGDRLQIFGPGDGVQLGAITAINGRGSEIWVGGEFGLQQFDHGRFHTIHAVDSELLRGISGIVETANGDLWLNGLGGIVHLRGAEIVEALKNPAHPVSGERFGRREGLPGLPSQMRPIPTAIEGADGRLWFTVNNGVVWLDPAQASNKIPPPPVTIQSVSADDKSYGLDQPLRFPAHTSSVQITYAAVSLSDPEAIHFRYKLQETDKDWHEVETSTAVSYRNLPPGTYHFTLAASDTNGLWSDNTATAEFTVLPAFYQTGWFRALCAVFLLVLLGAAYQWHLRHLRHQFEITLEARVCERTRIARDLHDTLLQSFHGLLLRFQTVSQLLLDRPIEAKEKLNSAIEQAANAITEGRDAVQGLRDSTVQTNDLARAINTLGDELAADPAQQMPPAFRVTVEGETRNLHPIVRDEIYQIAAEALRNAFRHARAQHLEVEIRYDDEQFRMRARDDGKGIDPAVLSGQQPTGHFGLNGMRERAKLAGGNLTVWSELDAGTEVELRVPAGIAYTASRRGSWWSRAFSGRT